MGRGASGPLVCRTALICFNFASTTFIGIRPGLATVLKYADRAVTRGVCLGLRMSLPIPVRRYFR